MINILLKFTSIFAITLLTAYTKAEENGSFMTCKSKTKLSPMDMNFPLKFASYNLSMNFNVPKAVEWRKYEHNQIGFFAKWGHITYQTLKYKINRLDVVAPSTHMIAGIRYPMEVQVTAKEKYGGIITISFLFEKYGGETNPFLEKLKFGSGKYPNAKFVSELKKPAMIRGAISLQELFKDQDKYLMYEGESLTGNCEPAIMFVSHHMNWISEKQFEDLVDDNILAITKARHKGQLVYQNIDHELNRKPYPINEPVKVPKTPSTLAFSKYTYNPEDVHSLGWIHPKYIPGWKKVHHKHVIRKVKKPQLPDMMKYIPFWYKRVEKDKLEPTYIIVPKGFKWTRNIQPATVPTYIRTNYTQSNGVRNIVKIDMPVRWNPHEKVHKKKKRRKHVRKARRHKLNLRGHQAQVFRFRRICTEWHMGVILNRYFLNKEQWQFKDDISGIAPGQLLQCKHWKVIRINHLGQIVNAAGKVIHSEHSSEECMTYISVILNKVNHPGLKDYVSRACGKYAYIKRAPHDDPHYVVPPIPPKDQKPMLAFQSSTPLKKQANSVEEQKEKFLKLLQP